MASDLLEEIEIFGSSYWVFIRWKRTSTRVRERMQLIKISPKVAEQGMSSSWKLRGAAGSSLGRWEWIPPRVRRMLSRT